MLLPMGYRVVDEADPVEVIRISPQDADSLIDENVPDDPTGKRTKLGGVAIGHFGGFFDQGWRKNDILWGRLDAAERIIETVLSAGASDGGEGEARAELVRRAQREIIREEFAGEHGRADQGVSTAHACCRRRAGQRRSSSLTDEQAEAVRN